MFIYSSLFLTYTLVSDPELFLSCFLKDSSFTFRHLVSGYPSISDSSSLSLYETLITHLQNILCSLSSVPQPFSFHFSSPLPTLFLTVGLVFSPIVMLVPQSCQNGTNFPGRIY